jgi:YidC/Oxa1 family membrane protein insertase
MKQDSEKQQLQQKAIWLIFCVFLAISYKEMVWDKYVKRAPLNPALENSSVTNPSPSSNSTRSVESTETTARINLAKNNSNLKTPTDLELKKSGSIEIITKKLKASISLLGGRFTSLELNDYRAQVEHNSPLLNLVEHIDGYAYPLGAVNGEIDDRNVLYSADASSSLAVKLKGKLEDGREIVKSINFNEDSYFIDVNIALSATDANRSAIELEWSRDLPKESPSIVDPTHTSGVVWHNGQHVAGREPFLKVPGATQELGNALWVATVEKYFAVVFMPAENSLLPARTFHQNELYSVRIAGDELQGKFRVYAGPKNYNLLSEAGNSLELIIDYGRLAFISVPLLALLDFFYNLLQNYGLAIIALTILVKLLLLPLTTSSFKQMKKMQDLQPDVQRIKDNIKDAQEQQQKLMALYKEKGVNPMGGCFPMLLQMPIFIGLYSALSTAIELRHAPFMFWITDLSDQERLMIGPMGVPVMVLLFVISMLVQQWMTPSTMDETQKKVMLVMPLVFGFMFAAMPAGLTLYWLTSNVISIGTTQALRKEGGKHPFIVTILVAGVAFILAFILTKISGTA